MKKKLQRQLASIIKELNNPQLKDAFAQIKSAIDGMEEAVPSSHTQSDFSIPADLIGLDHCYILYADGACRGNPGPGSFGCIVQDSNAKILLENSQVYNPTTNNKMELMGVISGIENLELSLFDKGMTLDQIKLRVFSDSKYVVDGITKWVEGWKKRGWRKADKKEPENLEMWKSLDSLKDKVGSIDFQWVKGHSGHPQNEYCDQIANKALDNEGY